MQKCFVIVLAQQRISFRYNGRGGRGLVDVVFQHIVDGGKVINSLKHTPLPCDYTLI